MKYSLLAVCSESKEFILIEKATKKVIRVSEEELLKLINSVEGVTLYKKKLIGTNGSLSRYNIDNNNLVILYKTDNGFIISDKNGRVFNNYISTIKGEYERIE